MKLFELFFILSCSFTADSPIVKDTEYIHLDGYVEHNYVYHPEVEKPYLDQMILWKYEPQYGRHVVKMFFVCKGESELEYHKRVGNKYHVTIASRQPRRIVVICDTFLESHTDYDVERQESEKFGTYLRARNEYKGLDFRKIPGIKELEELEAKLDGGK